MKTSSLIRIIIILFVFFASCSKESLVGINKYNPQSGAVALIIDKTSAPAEVQHIIAILSRSGYDTLNSEINISDSINVISFKNVPIGKWHLNVNAMDSEGEIIYNGQSEITVVEDETMDVYLTLTPVGSGIGNIRIYIDWGKKWTDYGGNPLLVKGPDSGLITNVAECKIISEENIYKMWFQSPGCLGNGIWYAESTDGLYWTMKSEQPALNIGNPGSWDDNKIIVGAVLKDVDNYKLYYSGWQDQYSNWQIGLAVSPDGINWQKYSAPVLNPGNEFQVGVTDVIKKDNIYYMYYTYRESINNSYKIALATSGDGINWTKNIHNPILTASESWEGNEISFPAVYSENNTFYMLYQNYTRTTFGIAASTDGINWKKLGPVFSTDNCNWSQSISYPFVRKFGEETLLYYTGIDINGRQLIGLVRKNN